MKESKYLKILDNLIEEIGIFTDDITQFKGWTFETKWYKCVVTPEDKVYVQVKEGKVFRIAEDSCLFCGLHSPVGGGHLFVGRNFKGGFFINRQGWISDGEKQYCPSCVKVKLKV